MTDFKVGDVLIYKGGSTERVVELLTVGDEPAIRLSPENGGPSRIALIVYANHFVNTGIWKLNRTKKIRLRLSA